MSLLEDFPFEPGFRLADGDVLNKVAAEPAYSADNAVTATGTNRETAYNIRATITAITAGGDQAGVRLPPPRVGRALFLLNFTATGKKIYGFDGDLINGSPTMDLPFGTGIIMLCLSPVSYVAAIVAANTASGDVTAVASDADRPTGDGRYVHIAGGNGGTVSGAGGDVLISAGEGSPNGNIIVASLAGSPSYADDAAAEAGGVPPGGLYRFGSAVFIRAIGP